jgi:glycosyltransferase involved in cell wall biosynthesis
MSQTYRLKELIILDDASDPSFPVIPECGDEGTSITYSRHSEAMSIPVKRNACCEVASGEIIWHLDSDDWSAPTRMAEQVVLLEQTGSAMTGYHTALFIDDKRNCWKYHNHINYAIGSSLCFRKSWWRDNPFDVKKRIASDNEIVRAAFNQKQLIAVDGKDRMVCRIHKSNTSNKRTYSREYKTVSIEAIPPAFFE